MENNIDAIFGIIDVMPKVEIKESAADLTTHAGKWTGEHEIIVITKEEQDGEVVFEALDKNYRLDFEIFENQSANADSIVLDIAKAPLSISVDTLVLYYGEAVPDVNIWDLN